MTQKEYLIATAAFIPLGPDRTKILLDFFGSAEKLWKSTGEELAKLGLSRKLVTGFTRHKKAFNEKEYFLQLTKLGISAITQKDKEYPKLLKEIPTAPVVLYVMGSLKITKKSVAIVGSRQMTSYGREVTDFFARGLAKKGITIVSGLARGIDTAAHKGALSVGGKTIAVLGCGLDKVYPSENTSLAREIVQKGGAIVSEYPLGYPPLATNFPARNRIISGLSQAVLVVEGRKRSGTLITASAAAEQGRTVLAVPGKINSSTSEASFFLIQNGAKMATTIEDVLEEIKTGS